MEYVQTFFLEQRCSIFLKNQKIKKVKKCKEGVPYKKNQRVRKIKWSKKRSERNEPQAKNRPRKVCKFKCHYYFIFVIKQLCAACPTFATIHE
jgi:hypothetical protein